MTTSFDQRSCTVSTLINTIFIIICMLKIARSIKVLRMNLFWWYPSMLTLLYIWCTNYDVCVYYFFYILNNVSIKFKQTKTTYFRTNNRINYIVIWFDLFNLTPLSAISWRPVLVVEEVGENHRPWATGKLLSWDIR